MPTTTRPLARRLRLQQLTETVIEALVEDPTTAAESLRAISHAIGAATRSWAADDLPAELGELAAEAENTLAALAGGLEEVSAAGAVPEPAAPQPLSFAASALIRHVASCEVCSAYVGTRRCSRGHELADLAAAEKEGR
jgi:hypothetical protein